MTYFPNYTRVKPMIPRAVWLALRYAVFGATMLTVGMLAVNSSTALTVFWGLLIPGLPAILVIAPGLWRQVCPMAFVNQLPRELGFSRGLTLPERAQRLSFTVAVAVFTFGIALRGPVLNGNGPVLACVILAFLGLALAGGYFFKGRSGWCGTFCPLSPIQREYGQAPMVVVRNGYCSTCVGCQKNCYDFNPRASVFADLQDSDPQHSEQRQLFTAMTPGLILGYFMQSSMQAPAWLHVALIVVCVLASAGSYHFVRSFLGVGAFRAYNAYAATAITIFYWFAGPIIVNTVGLLSGMAVPEAIFAASQFTGVALGAVVLILGRKSETKFKDEQGQQYSVEIDQSKRPRDSQASGASLRAVELSSGSIFPVAPRQTLLSAMEAARVKINYGCRAGMCGADVIEVCDGMEHLPPATEEELATLRRIGASPTSRLACMCMPHGSVVIDAKRRKEKASAAPAAAAKDDPAKALGIERVVVIGNGPAGLAAVESVRNLSQSVAITVLTDEKYLHYNRMALARIVCGSASVDELYLLPEGWYKDHRIDLLTSTSVDRIDRAAQRVVTSDGQSLPYDRLVIATGAKARLPDPRFEALTNTFVLRTADDAHLISEWTNRHGAGNATVLGGGVLGVESAEMLLKLGFRVTIIHNGPRLLGNLIDDEGAQMLSDYLQAMGVKIHLNRSVQEFIGSPLVTNLRLDDGSELQTSLIIACLGVIPDTKLASSCGLEVGNGIIVTDKMRTSDPNIFAVGDAAQVQGSPTGLWSVASRQGTAAAAAMLNQPLHQMARRHIMELKSEGIDLRCFGNPAAGEGTLSINSAKRDDRWWRLVVADGALVGATFVGPPGTGRDFARALAEGADADELARAAESGDEESVAPVGGGLP